MNYQLIAKVNGSIRVLKTFAGVQIWMKGIVVEGASLSCAACGKKIGVRVFFTPMAGEALPNSTERIHATCMGKLELLPMVANTFVIEEEHQNGKQHE